MATLLRRFSSRDDVPERVQLEISGPVLNQALQTLISGSEALGGVERYAEALKLKSTMFRDALGDCKVAELDLDTLMGLCTFMSTVRRRIAAYLDPTGLALIKQALVNLLDGAHDTTTTDTRWAAFCGQFPQDKKHRWVQGSWRSKCCHNTDPERYPLMGRWVWDAKANTGCGSRNLVW